MPESGNNVSASVQKGILTAVGLILLAVAGYAANSAIENSKAIAVNQTKIESVEKSINEIKETVKLIWGRMNER